MEPEASPDLVLVEALRRHRAELRDSMSAVENALAGPATRGGSAWAERVHVALVELSADLREHIDVTEGPAGLYRDVLASTPRLSEAVTRLRHDHVRIRDAVEELVPLAGTAASGVDVDRVRELGTALLGMLVRHRQQGSDLVYEAYEVDIGGET